MDNENANSEQPRQRWFIDLDWYQQHKRSFPALAQRCLCPGCRQRLAGDAEAADLMAAIKGCCSGAPGFITGELPILESIFRLLLANANQPIDVEEIEKQLGQRRGGDIYHTPPEVLSRLLQNDRGYGLQPAQDQPA